MIHRSQVRVKQYNLVTGNVAVMLFDREGNRKSGIALAMRHRCSGISTYGLMAKGTDMKIL